MASVIDIVNSALLSLGANVITSFNDGNLEAVAANAKWDIARRAVLRTSPWNFAMQRRILSPSLTPPVFDYKYAFTLPAEALRLVRVDGNMDYKLEGRDILTNRVDNTAAPELRIKYVEDNIDPATWDSTFVDVMVYRMAMELAYTLPRKNNMVELMNVIYQDKLAAAQTYDSQEDIEDPIDQEIASLIGVRYVGFSS